MFSPAGLCATQALCYARRGICTSASALAPQHATRLYSRKTAGKHTYTGMGLSNVPSLTEGERGAAIKAFEELGLSTQLAEAAAGLGWKSPSLIQQQAVPPLIAGVCRHVSHAAV
jgi:hypothetical protein